MKGSQPPSSGLYSGRVMHQRLRPLRHRLSYRMFSLLLDVDQLPALARRLRLFSLNRFNLFSLHEHDYTDGASGLREGVERQLHLAGLAGGGPICLLTMPRILGYAFNPLNVFFCYTPQGELDAVLYEVNNTFGQRHSYLIEVRAAGRSGGAIEQRCAKRLHVSPFLALDMHYRFRVTPPDAQGGPLSIGIAAHDDQGPVLNARFDAKRRPLSDSALAATLVSHPLLTLKVMGAIHWQALRLFIKGLRPLPKPAPPVRPMTVIRTEDS